MTQFGSSQDSIPLTKCEFVFTDRTITVAYQGSCDEALTQLYKSGKCTQDDIANIQEIKEWDLRMTG